MRNSLQKKRSGVVTVEMAIILPIFFALLMGAYDAARINMLRHTAQAAAYEGARRGILPGATIADIESDCEMITKSCGARNIQIHVTPSTLSSNTPEVEVIVEIPIRSNTLIASPFFGNLTMVGKTKFTREAL